MKARSGVQVRQSTSDPSCPANFVCKTTQCPGNVLCSSGEDCINVDGTLACVDSKAKVCALNPDTLEAVLCPEGKGVCCHGNCYTDEAVCCDFPNVKCAVGELCANVCQPGQVCGRSGCEGGHASSSTSHLIGPTSSNNVRSPSSSKVLVPTSLQSKSLAVPPTTTSSATSAPISGPTQVPSTNGFKLKGCFIDKSNDRVLKDGTKKDSLMTVEKCTESAEDWRYAGLESGSQCFWGNVQFNDQISDANDCNIACGGAKSEACGGENRILLYENPDYVDPTNAIYVRDLKDWREELDKMRGLITEFYKLVIIYVGQSHDEPGKRTAKRAPPGSLLTQIMNARNAVSSARPVLSSASNLVLRAAGRARAARVIDGNEYIELTSISSRTASAAEAVSAVDVSSPATIRTASRVATQAITVFGASEIVIAGVVTLQAVGIFFTLFQFIARHENDGNPVPTSTSIMPSGTPTMPSGTPTTTSSSKPSPTGVARTRIVTFTEDMTSAQFYATIAALVLAGNEITDLISLDKPVFYGFLGNLYDLDTLLLSKHPLIAGLGLNGMGRIDDLDLRTPGPNTGAGQANESVSTSSKQTRGRVTDQAVNSEANSLANSSILLGRDLQPVNAIEETVRYKDKATGAWRVLDQEPFALQWLGSLWAQNALTGNYVGYSHALIDKQLTKRVPVYVMDTGVDRDHEDFKGPNPQAFNFHIDVTEPNGNGDDVFGHGTAMAGCVAGNIGGTYKFAELVPVKVGLNDGTLPAWNAIKGIAQILARQQAIGNPGSVVSMSFSFTTSALRDVFIQVGYEPFLPLLQRLPRHNVVIVMSAGNLPNEPIGAKVPQIFGGMSTPLIIVGSTDANGHRSQFSSYIDEKHRGLLSLYVIGEAIVEPNSGGGYSRRSGTSPAAAMVAGMAARLIAANVAPAAIKSQLIREGIQLKGNDWDFDDGFPVARGGIKNQVPCSDPVLPPLATPTYTVYQEGSNVVLDITANFASPGAATSTCYDVVFHTPAILPTVTSAAT
ncbi:hypothetical protein VHEMI10671 [[Torrubiella] hemipterigena]|uniref:WSC domain-containing protein n=1 Tax=[Torrubiella] hemipterigena TaxID=1531966 RepID=A0A0A1TJD6_9HYPO|nr:hypothetical protein VHEMI10671 [[Torrubiella] hemipterigena]